MGVMLSQNIIGKSDQPIVYASRLLSKTKQNYNTTQKEALAMVFFGTNSDIICWAISLSFM
jgi:hypothetical protein